MRCLPAGNENRRAFFIPIYIMVDKIGPIARFKLVVIVCLAVGCSGKKSTIVLFKADGISSGAIAAVAGVLKDSLNFKVDTSGILLIPDSLWSSVRKRYRAGQLLVFMKNNRAHSGNTKFLLVTDRDLGIAFGQDSLRGANGLSYQNGNFAVISDYRLHQHKRPKDSVNIYLSKVALHEAGHMLGLSHCKSTSCIMEAIELKQHITTLKGFCPQCRKKLRQM